MYEITRHAEERYVQRMMGYADKGEIGVYIAKNQELIQERINKLVEFGELIFSGKIKDGNHLDFYVQDTWVVLLDKKKERVVTLYKVEIIKDDVEFNNEFVKKMKTKIKDLWIVIKQAMEHNEIEKAEFREKIENNKRRIREYETLVSELKDSNNAYACLIETLDTEVHISYAEYKQAIEDLVADRIF